MRFVLKPSPLAAWEVHGAGGVGHRPKRGEEGATGSKAIAACGHHAGHGY
jgi:hypothetical protein